MKKTLKTIIIVVIVMVVIGLAVGGYLIVKHNNSYIGSKAALSIALADAGLSDSDIFSPDVEFEKERGRAWYEVDFETFSTEFNYVLDAATGEILNSYSEPND